MKKIILIACTLMICVAANAQVSKLIRPKAEQSDPAARAVLDKVKKQYDALKGYSADFVIETELGDEKGKDKKGKLYIKGDKYRVEMADADFMSDGVSKWSYLKKNKEVQLSNASETDDEGMTSPADLLKIYQKPNFIYALMGENMEGGKTVQKIEFKPIRGFDDYSKVRVTIDKNSAQMLNLKVFEKSGARYTLKISNLVANNALADTLFVWDKTKNADVKVINLK